MECQDDFDKENYLAVLEPKEHMKKKKIKIFSDAFPPNKSGDKQKISAISETHKNFQHIEIEEDQIFFKEFNPAHLSEIKILHREWFPIKYDDSFFDRILQETPNKIFFNLGAFYKVKEQEVIIGGIFCEIKDEMQYKRFIPANELRNHEVSFVEDIINFSPDYEYLYIMTIGVIDKCRRLKLGSKLLNIVTDYFKKRKTCLGIYLHVVEYNRTAIQFYVKNEFMDTALVRNYYYIENEFYNAKVFVKFFSRENMDKEKLLELLIIKPIKILLYFFTLGMLCRCVRRKYKIL